MYVEFTVALCATQQSQYAKLCSNMTLIHNAALFYKEKIETENIRQPEIGFKTANCLRQQRK